MSAPAPTPQMRQLLAEAADLLDQAKAKLRLALRDIPGNEPDAVLAEALLRDVHGVRQKLKARATEISERECEWCGETGCAPRELKLSCCTGYKLACDHPEQADVSQSVCEAHQ